MSRISANNSAAASSYSGSPAPSASTPSESSTTSSDALKTYTTVKNAFKLIKKRDKDGGISIADLQQGGAGLTAAEQAQFKTADKNANGKLSLGDWMKRYKTGVTVQTVAGYVTNDANAAKRKDAVQIAIPADDFNALALRGDNQAGITMADMNINGQLPLKKLYEKRFKKFDKDNNGVLAQTEFTDLRGHVTNQKVAKLFLTPEAAPTSVVGTGPSTPSAVGTGPSTPSLSGSNGYEPIDPNAPNV